MPRTQTIVFTALPNGFGSPGPTGGPTLRLSVFVSPRLVDSANPGTLNHFPDWAYLNAKSLARVLGLRARS